MVVGARGHGWRCSNVDCTTARGLVWPPERLRLARGEIVLARSHVRDCEACQEYLAQDRSLLDLYDRARSARAPLEVRERVFDAIAGARWAAQSKRSDKATPLASTRRSALRRSGAWVFGVAAALTVSFLIGGAQGPHRADVEGPEIFVEDYLRRAVGQDHIETHDLAEVRRFLERELGLRFDPIHVAGLELARAEICLLEGRRGAMIVYKSGDAEVSHYLVPRADARERPPSLSLRESGPANDIPVVTWATGSVEQALVGGVSADQLLAIARSGAS